MSSLFLFASFSNGAAAGNVVPRKKIVVIDAGHGGPKFPGAHYDGVYEKNLNLRIALRLGKMIEQNLDGVEVVYTRKSDKQFSENLNVDLSARAEIANDTKNGHARRGDLFISIHANAAKDRSVTGTETLIMGLSTLEKSQNDAVLFANNREEFVDVDDEKTGPVARAYIQNLQFTYGEYSEAMARIVQKNYAAAGRRSRGIKRQPLKVLYATDMPSVLTEVGFMSNAKELSYMLSEKGQTELARALYRSVKEYFEMIAGVSTPDDGSGAPAEPEQRADSAALRESAADGAASPDAQTEEEQAAAAAKSGYTVQVMALSERVPVTKKLFFEYADEVCVYVSSEKSKLPYRYCIGEYRSQSAARREAARLQKKFKGAFAVRYAGDRIVK